MTAQSDHEKNILSNSSSIEGEERFSDLVPFLVAAIKRQGDVLFGFKKKILF